MKSSIAFTLMIGARAVHFCVDTTELIELCLPLVNKACNMLLCLVKAGSSAKSPMTSDI